jgi:hypothetical protein
MSRTGCLSFAMPLQAMVQAKNSSNSLRPQAAISSQITHKFCYTAENPCQKLNMSEQNQDLHDMLAVMSAQQEGAVYVPTEIAARLLQRVAELEQRLCKNCRFWISSARGAPCCCNEKNVELLATHVTPPDFGCVRFEKKT